MTAPPVSHAVTPRDVSFRVLDDASNADLLAITRACPLESHLTVRFDRDPDFFAWPRHVFEDFDYVGIQVGAKLVGYCLAGYCRGWNGREHPPFVYFGDARLLPGYRGRGLLQAAVAELKARRREGAAEGFFLIARGNGMATHRARRFSMPGISLRPSGVLEIANLPLFLAGGGDRNRGIRPARTEDVAAIAALLRRVDGDRSFAPALTDGLVDALLGDGPILIEERFGRMHGMIAWSDLTAMRRPTVLRYPAAAAPIRGAWSLASRVRAAVAPLPGPGQPLRTAMVTHLAAVDDDRRVLRSLVRCAMEWQSRRGGHLLQVGGWAGAPALQALGGLLRFTTRSDIWRFDCGSRAVSPRGLRPDFRIDLRLA